jgi:transposase
MVVVDGQGIPVGVSVASASPAEVKLAPKALATISVPRGGPGRPRMKPARLIADKAYDSDKLRQHLASRNIELICPHRRNRVRPPTQDGRKLRRYRRRWIIERTISWLGYFRRLLVRHEYYSHMYLAFIHFACAIIALRWL